MADEPKNIAFEDPSGRLQSLPSEVVAQGNYGIHEISKERADAKLDAMRAQAEQSDFDGQYNPLEHPLAAAGAYFGGGEAAWLRGVTGGLSDLAISKIGDALGLDARGQLNDWQRVHPWISKSEQLTGAAGGIAAGGAGLGAVGRGVLGGTALAEGAGGIATTLGLGEGTAARVAASTLARGAVEGGVFSAGEELSRQALSKDPDLHAERILSEMGHGALFGGPAALGLHGLSSLASSGLTSLETSLAKRAAREAAVESGEEGVSSLQAMARRGASKSDLAAHAAKLDEELSAKYIDKLRAVDASGTPGPSMQEFLSKTDDLTAGLESVEGPSRDTVGRFSKGDEVAVQDWIKDLHGKFVDKSATVGPAQYGDISFEDWEKASRELAASSKGSHEVIGRLRNAMRTVSDSALDVASAPKLDVEAAQSIRDLATAVRDARQVIGTGTAEEIAAKVGKPSIGSQASDFAKGKIANYATEALVHTALSPLGPVGHMIAPAAKALIRKIAEGASIEGISSAVREHIQSATKALASGGKVAVDSAIEPLGIALGNDVRVNAEKIRDRATSLATNPERQLHYATEAAASLRAPTPIAAAIGASVSRVVNALATRAPKDSTPKGLFKVSPLPMSDSEAARYVSVAKALAAPRSIISDASRGTLTKDQVDAVKEGWPNLYPEIAGELTKAIAGGSKQPDYQKRISISVLLGIEADPTMAPGFVAATQPAEKESQSGGGPSPRSGKPIHLPSLALSSSGADSAIARAQSGGKKP
jgi:hypothetical protein